LIEVGLIVDLAHLVRIILVTSNWVVELVDKLLIVSVILLHLKLAHGVALVLHLLVHVLDHCLVPHQQALHPHLIALLWCVLMNRKCGSVSHLPYVIRLLGNRRQQFRLRHSHVTFVKVLGT
jgi:hypothetical protein